MDSSRQALQTNGNLLFLQILELLFELIKKFLNNSDDGY